MPRRRPELDGAEPDFQTLLKQLSSEGDGALTIEQKLDLLETLRRTSGDARLRADRFVLEELARFRRGLADARETQEEMKELLDKLAASPWFPAVFLGPVTTLQDEAALVSQGPARRVVGLSGDVSLADLDVGDEVLLGPEQNVILARTSCPGFQSGETASFQRQLPDGRLALRGRDEQVVVQASGTLQDEELKAGDEVRWDRQAGVAFERIEKPLDESLFLEETPTQGFDGVAGLEREIEQLQRSIRLHLYHPEATRRYRLHPRRSVLLVGPPGTGKTMLARALANWLATISGSGRSRFMSIKPGGLHSMWYAESEANYRKAFRVAREAGDRDPSVPVVMFFDEVDSLGAARGQSLTHVDDRVLDAFMSELDGLESRGNVLVVAATNRREALDPALLRAGRLGDLVLEVPRPNGRAARQILSRYFHHDLPYAGEGDASASRRALLDAIVSRAYAPNGAAAVATLTFRDGAQRPVVASDLVSGATIANVARAASERAALRSLDTGRDGVELLDALDALDVELSAAARALTPGNCRRHLSDLPQDVDVVRVEPVVRKVRQPLRYLNAA